MQFEGGPAAESADIAPLSATMAEFAAVMEPLFGIPEGRIRASDERIRARAAAVHPTDAMAVAAPDDMEMDTYYAVSAREENLDELAEALLRQSSLVEAAYVKPESGEPIAEPETADDVINMMKPMPGDAPAVTPNFTSSQIYLDPAPAGIDARYAWSIAGGRGAGVRIIDCEWGWNFSHEDLIRKNIGVVYGSNSIFFDHGTAVLGEYSGDVNSFGITGICSDALAGASSFANSPSTARTIREAADRLDAGDIILLEIHRAGPNATGSGQFGFIAIEWWPDDFAAIRYATNKRILVVEAAGNGAQNFDDAIYDQRPSNFPPSWRNPFNPANPSSLAVVVGAGAPPPGTHGQNYGVDRSRLGFSNYGKRVDCQGWGREVTTTGYGDLQGGPQNQWYTETFSGTSSASPIVVGALGCVQGTLKAKGTSLLTPSSAINLLRTTGSPQQDTPGRPKTQRIGNRPDLRQLIPSVAVSSLEVGLTGNEVTDGWHRIMLAGSYNLPPVIVAAMQTFNGGDPAGLRLRHLEPGKIDVRVEEERSKDSEVTHVAEAVGYLAIEHGAIKDASSAVIGEAGSLLMGQTSGSRWRKVSLTKRYNDPIVIAQIATYNGSQPCHTRIRRVTREDFEIQIEEWDYLDQEHTSETINFIVFERGEHQLGGSHRIVAGRKNTDHRWKQVTIGSFGVAPILLSHSQTYDGSQAVVTRQRNITNNGGEIRLQEEEANDGTHVLEEVGYVAISRSGAPLVS